MPPKIVQLSINNWFSGEDWDLDTGCKSYPFNFYTWGAMRKDCSPNNYRYWHRCTLTFELNSASNWRLLPQDFHGLTQLQVYRLFFKCLAALHSWSRNDMAYHASVFRKSHCPTRSKRPIICSNRRPFSCLSSTHWFQVLRFWASIEAMVQRLVGCIGYR